MLLFCKPSRIPLCQGADAHPLGIEPAEFEKRLYPPAEGRTQVQV